MAKSPYKISSILYGHDSDVRAVATFKDGSVVSASRDKTARLWKPNGINAGFTASTVFKGHKNFVSSVCVINPSARFTEGFVITGSNDNTIAIYLPKDSEPLHVIQAHQNTVCCLSVGREEGTFLSSSWDLTAKLWHIEKLDQPLVTLTGHAAAVWCVVELPNGIIVTGSADKIIKAWHKNGSLYCDLTGHTDCVRGLCVIKDDEFLSCANDATVRHWNVTHKACLGTYCGHANYIYGITSRYLADIIQVFTSSEDRTVKIWLNGEIEQSITLPVQSVWCIDLLPNGDFVTGASDGLVRIFSADPERYADTQTQQCFEEAVAKLAAEVEQEIGGIKISSLPDIRALAQPGQRDGQTKMVRDGETVKAYSWSEATKKWDHVGDVMGASGGSAATSGKQLYNGIEYDYVFSVDIQDGVPPLKLPYNIGTDPWCAAQKFIHDNNLSQLFLDQVANFIVKNSQAAPVLNVGGGFADPFTGGNRYIPGSTVPTAVPSSNPTPTPSTSTSNISVSNSYIPHGNYLKFGQANLAAIFDKLNEFNRKFSGTSHAVAEPQIESLSKLMSDESISNVGDADVATLRLLLAWPKDEVFPVLDITRLAVLRREINEKICDKQLLDVVHRYIQTDASHANHMLAFRLLANMFSNSRGEELALQHRDEILEALTKFSCPGKKNNQVAVATYILNLVVALKNAEDPPGRTLILNTLLATLPLLREPEAIFRALVSLGTLLATTLDPDQRRDLASIIQQSESALGILSSMSDSSTDSVQKKLVICSKEIIDLIL